ncbi:MAG: hypothetical protein RLZZ186_1112 [Cyanobacteriota bacterium]
MRGHYGSGWRSDAGLKQQEERAPWYENDWTTME